MIVKHFESEADWRVFREGKITGSVANDIFSVKEPTKEDIVRVLEKHEIDFKKSSKREDLLALIPAEHQSEIAVRLQKKLGFYELLAHRISVKEDGDEDPMNRGKRLEEEALKQFAKVTKKKISNDLVVWVSETNESLAYSPDGCITDEEVAEVKCLSSAWHLYIYYEKEIPVEYKRQNIQAFIVNDKLQKLHFVLYDPRIKSLPLHWITITRDEVAGEIELYKKYEADVMREIDALVSELTF